MRSTKIVATIGPASRDPAVLERMVAAGMDVARLNFAHGDPDEHAETVAMVRAASERVGREVAVLQDIPGPKLRIGPVAGDFAGIEMGVDAMALSFIRRGADLEPVRERLAEHGSDLPVIAKIEKPQAAAGADEIVEAADGIMVARGDLGIELPIEEVPLVQKRLLHVAGQKAKPSITATQMLESMVSSTRPTRAEVADVANAIFDGTDAVMLSQETAIGRDPAGAVEMMAAIAESTERDLPYWRMLTERGLRGGDDSAAIAFGAVGAVYQLGLKALVCPTLTGKTARLISSHRPQVPTLALSPRIEVVRRCSIYWGVHARLQEEPHDTPRLLEVCAEQALEHGVVEKGDK